MRFPFLTVFCLCLAINAMAAPIIPNEEWNAVHSDDDFKNIHVLVAEKFASLKTVKKTNLSLFTPAWPIADTQASLLTRFGTPTSLIFNEEESSDKLIMNHEALDITRSSTAISDNVFSPVDGLATVVHEEGEIAGYSTTVAILDMKSNLVISMLHVNPSSLFEGKDFIQVKKGDLLGSLSLVVSMSESSNQEKFKHTHVAVIDLERMALVNPTKLFDFYKDTVAPEVRGMTILDENGNATSQIVDGKIDLAISMIDRDGINDRNFEVAGFSLKVKDNNDRKLLNIQNCNLDFLTNKLDGSNNIRDGYYLNEIGRFTNLDFNFESNASVKEREFSYAVTNFSSNPSSCELIKDSEGFILVDSTLDSLTVELEVMDHHGNKSMFIKTFTR